MSAPPFTPLIFYGMDGWLLGREYFQVAAMRREGRDLPSTKGVL